MPKMGFRADGDENVYVYLESKSGSAICGIDAADNNRLKISAATTTGLNPDSASPMMVLDPRTGAGLGEGDIVLLPKGSGGSGSVVIQSGTISQPGASEGVLQVDSSAQGYYTSSKGTDGQLLIGNTSGSLAWQTLTAGTGVSITNGAASISVAASSVVPIDFNTDSGNASASSYVLVLTGTNGVTTSASGNTVTISGTATPFTWNEVTGTSQNMVVNNGYVVNNASLVTLTLPSSAVFGDTIKVMYKGSGGWRIAQNVGQTIYFGNQSTTTGVGGYLESSEVGDCITLVCITAYSDWRNPDGSQGNITVV